MGDILERMQAATLPATGGDVPGDATTSATLTTAAPIEGVIDPQGDHDWYRFDAEAGTSYVFDLEGKSTGAGTLAYPYLRLLDASGNEIRTADFGDNAQLGFTATVEGPVFVSAEGGSEYYTGSYRLSAGEVAGDVADNTATDASLLVGGSVDGNIDYAGDRDWFRVEAVVGKTYVFDLEGQSNGSGTLNNPFLRLLDANGNEIGTAVSGGEGGNAQLGFTADVVGPVFVSAEGANSDYIGSYRLSASELLGDVPDNPATDASLLVGGSVDGNIDYAGDRDWIRVEAVAGKTYVFDLEGADTGAGTLARAGLGLFDADGNQVASDYGGGEGYNARLGFTTTRDGPIFVEALGATYGDENGNLIAPTGTYRLDAREVLGDVPDNAGTGATLTVGSSTGGSIDFAGDQDWYRVTVEAGKTYVFDLEGVGTGAGTLTDPYLRLLDADGNQINFNYDAGEGGNARLVFDASQDGSAFLSAEGVTIVDSQDGVYTRFVTGDYRVSAREVIDDPAADTTTEATLRIGSSVTGAVDYGGDDDLLSVAAQDSDWYRVEVEAGKTYAFDLEGAATGAGTLASPYLRLLDADGNEMTAAAGGTAELGLTATADGPVFVSAQGLGDMGTYRLSAHEVIDDVPDNVGTSQTLPVGSSLSGTVDYANDGDWYRVEVEAGKTYVFDLEGAATGAGTLANPLLRLLDADGNELNSGSGSTAELGFAATADGPLFVSAQGWGDIGTYRLSAHEVIGDVPDNAGTSGTLAIGGALAGAVDYANDSDWYRVEVEAGKSYLFDLEGAATGAGTLANPSLRLLDAAGNGIRDDDDSGAGNNAEIPYTASADGVVFVSATAHGPSDGGPFTGSYRLSAREIVGDVPDNASTAAILPVDGSVTGTIDYAGEYYGDQDWFRFEVQAGKTYVFDLEGADTGAGTLADPAVRVVDAEGNELAPGSGGVAALTANTDGTVFVSAEADRFADEPTGGTYRLSARELVGDVPDNATTEATLKVGTSITGTIDYPYDLDWFRLELEAGKTYIFDFERGAADASASLRLLDDKGNQLTSSYGSGEDGTVRVGYTAALDGQAYLEAGGSGSGDAGGAYLLSARELVGDVPDNIGTEAELPVGGTAAGTIDYADDRDWFRVEVEAGKTYAVDIEGAASGAGTLPGTSLRLLDGHGNEIKTDQGRGELGFAATVDGPVYVEAGGGYGNSGTYRLTAREIVGDVPDSTATEATLTVGGSRAGTVDYAGDSDWFRVKVEAGKTYAFDLEGAATGAGSLGGAALELSYAGGSVLRHDEGGGVGGNARITYTPSSDGELFVAASGVGAADTGSYRLSAHEEDGGLWGDLPQLYERQAMPDAAIQASDDNAPAAGGEVFLTWIGGVARFDNALGVARVDEFGRLDPQLAFASSRAVATGDAISLGTVHVEDRLGLFAISDGGRTVPGLDQLGPHDLALRNPTSGEPAQAGDDVPPELVRLDGAAPTVVDADLVFALDSEPWSPTQNMLNVGGFAQATVGSFTRDGLEVCRIIAFEDTPFASGHSDGDFNDAIVALSVGRLSAADVSAIHDLVMG